MGLDNKLSQIMEFPLPTTHTHIVISTNLTHTQIQVIISTIQWNMGNTIDEDVYQMTYHCLKQLCISNICSNFIKEHIIFAYRVISISSFPNSNVSIFLWVSFQFLERQSISGWCNGQSIIQRIESSKGEPHFYFESYVMFIRNKSEFNELH